MKLSNCSLLPGVVVNANDPKNLGRVQCIIAGKSNPETMNTDHLFWCSPFCLPGYQRMSKPMEGQKIWVLSNEENYYEYYYIPAWDVNQNTAVIPAENDYDVLVSRPGEGFGSQMFYTMEQGFVQRIGNDISSTMKADNSIVHTDNNVEFAIRDNHVYTGSVEKDYDQQAVLGNKLYDLLTNLKSRLTEAAEAAKDNCYTSQLYMPLSNCAQAIEDGVKQILSEYVKLN